jgi:ribokinase
VSDLRFAVVGAYVADCLVRTPRIPGWGEEIQAHSIRTAPGGKALNQAVALARLGARVSAVGVVGDDGVGRDVLAALGREGIDTGCVERRAGVATPVCLVLVGDTGQNSIVWRIDEAAALTRETILGAAAALDSADAVLITFEAPAEVIREAIVQAGERGSLVIVQPAPPLADPVSARALPWELTDVVVCNEGEARALLASDGGDTDGLAAALARQAGARAVVITLGAAGVVCWADGSSCRYPAHHAGAVLDTTGAGDAFAATLTARLAAGACLHDAVDAGQAAAAHAIQRAGGSDSMPRPT